MPKTVHFVKFEFEILQEFSDNNLSQSTSQITLTTDRRAEITRQLGLEHLNVDESELIEIFCFGFSISKKITLLPKL